MGGTNDNIWIGACAPTCPEGASGNVLGGSGIDLSYNKAVMSIAGTSPDRAEAIMQVYRNTLKGADMSQVLANVGLRQTAMMDHYAAAWAQCKTKLRIQSDEVGYKDGKLYVVYQDDSNRYISGGIPVGKILACMGCPGRFRRKVAGRIKEIFNPPDNTLNLPRWKSIPSRI